MELKIITPERTVLEASDARHVLLPAQDGELGVLPGHIAMMCSLAVGRIRVDLPDQTVYLATSGGFVEVAEDRITVLADTAEKAEEIDVERARRAIERAREALRRYEEKAEIASARAAIARASNRIQVAGEQH